MKKDATGKLMKRIAIITNIPAPYRVDFFDYLQKQYTDYKFVVIYSSRNEDNRKWEIDQNKMNHCVFLESCTIKIKKHYDTKYIHIPRGVAKTLAEISPDAVVASEYNPTVIQALLYCKKNKVPFVSWTDGTLFSERNINFIQKVLRKYAIANASAYIGSSTKSQEAQIHYGAEPEKCHISYLTVDIEKYIQKPQGKGIGKILCVGSLIERKGVDLLLNALSKVQGEYQLYLAGEGSEKESIRELAKELNLTDKICFLGQLSREELLRQYADSDLFVLPTREDCFALVILEAMCSGLPVICSKYADGAYDLIEEGKNGFIVDPYDTDRFAEVIERLLADQCFKKELQQHSETFVEKFRFKNVAKGYMEAIESVL